MYTRCMDVTDDLIAEQSYLVARGVRLLALVGHCQADELEMLRTATRIERLAVAGAIPFVADRGDGVADYGFASHAWAIDLYQWAAREDHAVPDVHRHRVIGMLLGYDAASIREHEELGRGRRFALSSA